MSIDPNLNQVALNWVLKNNPDCDSAEYWVSLQAQAFKAGALWQQEQNAEEINRFKLKIDTLYALDGIRFKGPLGEELNLAKDERNKCQDRLKVAEDAIVLAKTLFDAMEPMKSAARRMETALEAIRKTP